MASVQILGLQATHVLVAVDLLELTVILLYVSLPKSSEFNVSYIHLECVMLPNI